jgi:hypothetical protein
MEQQPSIIINLKEIIKKCSDDISLDIILDCQHRYPSSIPLLLNDVSRHQFGGFLLEFLADEAFDFKNIGMQWDKWVAPHLSHTHHNVVIFDNVDFVFCTQEGIPKTQLGFKWLYMECNFVGNKEKNGLYFNNNTTVNPNHLINTCRDLIERCSPIDTLNTIVVGIPY